MRALTLLIRTALAVGFIAAVAACTTSESERERDEMVRRSGMTWFKNAAEANAFGQARGYDVCDD